MQCTDVTKPSDDEQLARMVAVMDSFDAFDQRIEPWAPPRDPAEDALWDEGDRVASDRLDERVSR